MKEMIKIGNKRFESARPFGELDRWPKCREAASPCDLKWQREDEMMFNAGVVASADSLR